MKPSLQPGLTSVKRIAIDRDRTISFMGEDARVYATPRLIGDIEYTCRDLIVAHADPGEDSVGMEVAVKHLASRRSPAVPSRSPSALLRSMGAR